MKMIHSLKSNILLIAGLIAVVLTMSFTQSNTENGEKIETADTVYHYVSSDMTSGAFANPANWSTTNANGACSSPEPIRPCKITVPEGSSLSSVLSGKNNDEVLDILDGYKGQP